MEFLPQNLTINLYIVNTKHYAHKAFHKQASILYFYIGPVAHIIKMGPTLTAQVKVLNVLELKNCKIQHTQQ